MKEITWTEYQKRFLAGKRARRFTQPPGCRCFLLENEDTALLVRAGEVVEARRQP